MPDLDILKDELLGLLKEEAKDLWDGEEDTELLKEVGLDIAKIRAMRLVASSDSEKDALKHESKIAEETIRQRLQQKKNKLNQKGQLIFLDILSTILKVAVTLT